MPVFDNPVSNRTPGAKRTEHISYRKDRIIRQKHDTIDLAQVQGDSVEIRKHYKNIHEIFLDDSRSFKIFKPGFEHLALGVKHLASMGVFDASLCPDLRFIVNGAGKTVGYSQPRGLTLSEAQNLSSEQTLRQYILVQQWILLSRMLRHDVFSHDIGSHNFVFSPEKLEPMAIDLENYIINASSDVALSVYSECPDSHEISAAEANLRRLFKDIAISIYGRDPISVLWSALYRSKFLSSVNDALCCLEL